MGAKPATRSESIAKNARIFEAETIPFLMKWDRYLSQEKDVLIVGCGSGFEIPWLAPKTRSVTAVDIDPEALSASENLIENLANVSLKLVQADKLPFPENSFDVILMHNVCEHLLNAREAFSEYQRVLRRGGIILNKFSPLFYSPFGAHLSDALRFPWGPLIFGIGPVVEVRNLYYPNPLTAQTWGDLTLNKITERKYRRVIAAAGLEAISHQVSTSRNVPLVQHIPLVRNLFILGIESVLTKKTGRA